MCQITASALTMFSTSFFMQTINCFKLLLKQATLLGKVTESEIKEMSSLLSPLPWGGVWVFLTTIPCHPCEPCWQPHWQHGCDGHGDHGWIRQQGQLCRARKMLCQKEPSGLAGWATTGSNSAAPTEVPGTLQAHRLSFQGHRSRNRAVAPWSLLLPGWAGLAAPLGWVAPKLPLKPPSATTTPSAWKFLSTFFSLGVSTSFFLWDERKGLKREPGRGVVRGTHQWL